MTRTDRIDIALTELVDLRKLHEEFLEFLAAHGEPPPRTGNITVRDGEIFVTCLGISLQCQARPVTDGGKLAAYEYSFVAEYRGEAVVVFTMFLKPDSTLLLSFVNGPQICTSRNEYIATRITDAIASELLSSKVFRAAKAG